MSTKTFQCKKCRKVFEELVHGGVGKKVACPECGGEEHQQLMSDVSGGVQHGQPKTSENNGVSAG